MAGADRISQLAEAVRYHRELYYNHASPEISDAQFDALWNELQRLDPDNSQLHQVGPEPLPGTVKVEHMFPMRSLGKGTSNEDIIHFITQSTSGGKQYLAQPKLDGSALSLEYIAGNLHRAATRGSGERGEDVTLNAKLVANIPLRLNLPVNCHVRGEVVMPLKVFEDKYRDVSPNPRNLCSGALRQKHGDGKADASDLVFWAYDVQFVNNAPEAQYDSERLEFLKNTIGIEPAPWQVFASDSNQTDMIQSTIEWSEKRSSYEYEIDGIVFKLDNLEQREVLGSTAHHPRWALAWKFPPEEATSVLLDVQWQTGRTGVVTPVATIAPQTVGGVTVEHTTLHNVGEVERLGLSIGDRVLIVRRGDVIPKIESSLGPSTPDDLLNRFHADGTQFEPSQATASTIVIPEECPACGGSLTSDGAFLRCSDLMCEARTSRTILYWCRALEMDGIGEKFVEQLLEHGMIHSIPDLYRLQQAEIENMERMGTKSALNVLEELAKTKHPRLGKFLHALGLPGIGPELAMSVAQHQCSFTNLMHWVEDAGAEPGDENFGPLVNEKGKPYSENQSIRSLCSVEGIGSKVAVQVRDGLANRMAMLLDLANILDIQDELKVESGGALEGMTFCLTGTLQRPRKEVQNSIKAAGGKTVGSVSSQLSVLLAGEKAGSKLAKAQSLGVAIWNEQDLENALSEPDSPSTEFENTVQPIQRTPEQNSKQPSLFDFHE
ncbi:MAG: hypothetical protein CMA63_08015 [Euryarchaeota archaeon]|nr:hypothetical protein [Euryarchaeota archaeon]